MLDHALSMRWRRLTDRVVGGSPAGSRRRWPRATAANVAASQVGLTTPMPPAMTTARAIAEPMARTAPSRPTTKRSWWRSTARAGQAVDDEQRHARAARQDELVGRDVERARDLVGHRRRGERGPVGVGVELRRADRLADAEAGDAPRCPRPPRGRRRGARPRGPRRGRPATSGSFGVDAAADGHVRLGRVGEVAEGQRATDDRDRVARLEARLDVAAIARVVHAERGERMPWPAWRVHPEERGDGRLAVGHPRRDGAARPRRQAGRATRRTSSPFSSNTVGRVPARPAREDPDAARGVAHPEPDRALLVEVAGRGPASGSSSSPRMDDAVVDARPALERRDEGHLGRLDRRPRCAPRRRPWWPPPTWRCRRAGWPCGSRPGRGSSSHDGQARARRPYGSVADG